MKKAIGLIPVFLFACSWIQAQEALTWMTRQDSFLLFYKKELIFKGKFSRKGPYKIQHKQLITNGASQEMLTITAKDFSSFEINGEIMAGEGAIACESEPRDAGLRVVRHSYGPSYNLRNNAVYHRTQDWLLSFDMFYPTVKIAPAGKSRFAISVKGWEITIRFRPDYFQKHRGLSYFKPAEYQVWKKPVVGWCSWFAYFNKVTETDVRKTTDILAVKLKKYGLEYVQIDDGYQQTPMGFPNTWLQANAKFPSGLEHLAAYIHNKGFSPGIWTNVSFADSAMAYQNRQYFVLDDKHQPALGNWVGYVMDGSNPSTLRDLIAPVYKGLNEGGWQYYKLDALRHLKYEGYNSYSSYFKNKHIDPNEAFRKVAKAVRAEIGDDHFLLACWGIRPELVGIANGCRIGNDGFSYAGLAQFNSYNNIIWRNDPDHIELSPREAYRSCTATSLTGSLFMLTDKAEVYEHSPLIEAAIHSIPVLFTQPGQVYDVDPSRSALVAQADLELSGSGPRPFDASTSTTTGLFALDVSLPFENWLVLGRLDERDPVLPFKDLGLAEDKEYLVFEFWNKRFEGSFRKQFEPDRIDTNYRCQVFCFREKQDHPQLLATNRHISCGALEIESLSWSDGRLKGSSELVAGDDYTIYLHEPEGFVFDRVNISEAVMTGNELQGALRILTLRADKGGKVNWEVAYKTQ